MGGSRLRPFLGVGLAYFLIAVLVPGALRFRSVASCSLDFQRGQLESRRRSCRRHRRAWNS